MCVSQSESWKAKFRSSLSSLSKFTGCKQCVPQASFSFPSWLLCYCFLTLFLSLTHRYSFYYLNSVSGNFVPGSFCFQGVYFAPWPFEGEDAPAFTLLRMGVYYSTDHLPTNSAYTLSATVLFLCPSEEDALTEVLHGNMPSSQNPILQSPHFTV